MEILHGELSEMERSLHAKFEAKQAKLVTKRQSDVQLPQLFEQASPKTETSSPKATASTEESSLTDRKNTEQVKTAVKKKPAAACAAKSSKNSEQVKTAVTKKPAAACTAKSSKNSIAQKNKQGKIASNKKGNTQQQKGTLDSGLSWVSQQGW